MKHIFILSATLLFCSGIRATLTVADNEHYATIGDAIRKLESLTEEPLNLSCIFTAESYFNINESDSFGCTLLSCALNRNFHRSIRELIQRGANVPKAVITAIDHDNTQALTALITFLKQLGQSIDMPIVTDGCTPLSCAILANSTNCIDLLKRHGALLKNAYKACIHTNNIPLFNALASKVDRQETYTALQELVLESLSQESLEQFNSIKMVIGISYTHILLSNIDEQTVTNQQLRERLVFLKKRTLLDLALEQNDPDIFARAWSMPGIIDRPWFLLKQAVTRSADNITAKIATMGLVTLNNLQPLLASYNTDETTQNNIAFYVQTYLAHHIDNELKETIRSLYHLANNRLLAKVADEMLMWVMEKETDTCIEKDKQEKLATTLAALDSQRIHISRTALLSQAVQAEATKIITWLADQGIRLDLNHVIELLDEENYHAVQQYLRYVITDVIHMNTEASRATLLPFKYVLKQKIDTLNIAELSTWYTKMIAPLVIERLEP